MGNCMARRRKKKNKDKKPKNKDKNRDETFGVQESRVNGHFIQEEEVCKKVKLTPLGEENEIHTTDDRQIRKVLRLILPYIPQKEWGKLREVCSTWASVVDGEWARMHTIDLSKLIPNDGDRKKQLQLADYIGSNCKLSRNLVSSRGYNNKVIDLSDEEFWRRLLPRTNDLVTLKLNSVRLPKYFFTDFVPACVNLTTLEIVDVPEPKNWTKNDQDELEKTVKWLPNLSQINLKLNKGYENGTNYQTSPYIDNFSQHQISNQTSNHYESDHIKNHSNYSTDKFSNEFYDFSQHQPSHKSAFHPVETPKTEPYVPRDIDAILSKSAGPNLKIFNHDSTPLTATALHSLASCVNLSTLWFDLNLDYLNPHQHSQNIRRCFSSFQHLKELRINIITNDKNTYDSLQALALILSTIADYSRELTTLKLIRMPDPMGMDKQLATDITTAFVKLNDETKIENLHICILAPQELFHIWSLPWSALTHLRTLKLTDCNIAPERLRGIDLELMPGLTTFTLCSDSLDDDTLTRVFAQPHPGIIDLTLEPGPKGIGKRGMLTVAVAVQNLRRLTISYSKTNVAGGRYQYADDRIMDSRDWTAFFRMIPDTLKQITLIDIDQRYWQDNVVPVSTQCKYVDVKPVFYKANLDTYGEGQSVSNGVYNNY